MSASSSTRDRAGDARPRPSTRTTSTSGSGGWSARSHTPRLQAIVSLATVGALVATAGAAYDIREGDTLSAIAVQHGTSVDALVTANGIADPDLIYIGDSLEIPGVEEAAVEEAAVEPVEEAAVEPTVAAPATAPVTAIGPTGDPADQRVHVVQPGESVESIAQRYDISVDQFMAANGFTSRGQLLARSRVQMAATGPAPGTGTTTTGHYVVQSGDTLEAIASNHGTTIDAMAGANDLANASFIVVGQKLAIPDGGPGYTCPVPEASFVNDWGVAKDDGRFHQGIDLMAPTGTPVVAPTAGTLVQIDGVRGGLQFRLDGDDGYTHFGSHMDAFGASGTVAAGEVIGYIGTTGNAVGGPSHLHYSVSLAGDTINPYPSLAASC